MKINEYISHEREDFEKGSLDESILTHNPFELFETWFNIAISENIGEPYAMLLATCGSNNIPISRTVYMRDFSEKGLIFYTNYESRKGKQIEENPNVSVTFLWRELEKQIIISGKAEKVDAKISDEYFSKRPRGSQLGAWASAQSHKIKNREELELKLADVIKKFEGKEVTRPPYWGGYILKPNYFEFWQGRKSRLHDRITFSLKEDKWDRARLSP